LPFQIRLLWRFKSETTKDAITAHAGLALVGEFAVGLGLLASADSQLPKAGSGAGYQAHEYIFPLALMLHGGGIKGYTLDIDATGILGDLHFWTKLSPCDI